jgi:hypothetical protein
MNQPVPQQRRPTTVVKTLLDVLAVFVVFALLGAWPTPDVNEAHYLTKARHFWDPSWCERDLFLSSGESHVSYYATFGYLTQFMSFDAAAWCGRFLGWLMLAVGWRHLSFALAPKFGLAAVSGACAFALNQQFQMSGEWFVGGIEAKVPAYALVFFGLGDIFRSRWNRGLLALGGGAAFHVLVGGWSIVAVAVVWLFDARRPSLISILPGLFGAAIVSLAGVLPGLALSRGVDATALAEADQLYVFRRLAHHLWAVDFLPKFGLRHFALILGWVALCRINPVDEAGRRLRCYVATAILLTVIGTAISYASPTPTAWAARLLKYYWFRLSDVAVAVGVTFELARAATQSRTSEMMRIATIVALAFFATYGAVLVAKAHFSEVRPRSERIDDAVTYDNWKAACRWIRDNLPEEAVVITPRSFTTFKWFAERAEYATWKDVPQDARSLAAWSERLNDLYGVDGSTGGWVNYVPLDQLWAASRKHGATHVITYAAPPLELPVLYRNNSFVVYEIMQP